MLLTLNRLTKNQIWDKLIELNVPNPELVMNEIESIVNDIPGFDGKFEDYELGLEIIQNPFENEKFSLS